jgi:hypothetical protein
MSDRVVQAALPLEAAGGPAARPRGVAGDEGPGPLMTAYWNGVSCAGRRGSEDECPHPEGSPERQHWLPGCRREAKTMGGGFSSEDAGETGEKDG